MRKITLPTPATGSNQAYFSALNGYLIPDYFDSVKYCDTAGNEYASVDAMDGSSYVVTRVYYYKHGIKAMCFILASGALQSRSPLFAGSAGITDASSGIYIQAAPTALTVLTGAILLGEMQANTALYTALLVKHGTDTIAMFYKPPYYYNNSRYNAALSTLNLGKGKTNNGNQIQILIPSPGTDSASYNLYPSYFTITVQIPTIDGAESVLTNIRYLLAGPEFNAVSTETIGIDGVVYDKVGLLLIPRETT